MWSGTDAVVGLDVCFFAGKRYYHAKWKQEKNWYDGYRFGSAEVYCPWDVVNYVSRLRTNPKARPQNFWANSSGNDAVREFVRRLDTGSARRELESLVEGGTVRKKIHPELTYRDMYSSIENLWSLLYMTGYLTGGPDEEDESDMPLYRLSVPNTEIRGNLKKLLTLTERHRIC